MHCQVEIGDGRTRGQTICDIWNYVEGDGKIILATGIEVYLARPSELIADK